MKENFILEDIIKALKNVGDNARADELVAEIFNISVAKVWEIEDNFELSE